MPEWRLLLRVAGEESGRYFRGFNKRVLVFVVVAAAIGVALLPPILDRGVTPDEGLYRAEIMPGSPLRGALEADRRFEVFEGIGGAFQAGQADLLIQGTTVFFDENSERSTAAIHDFAEFTQRYFDERLGFEANQTAAFPVRVNVVYQPRALPGAQGLEGGTTGGGGPIPTDSTFTQPNTSLVLQQSGETQLNLVPGKVEPPFPMRSLLLTFLYLVPMNFIGQYYAGSLLAERTRNRGVLLLSAPLTGPQILFGKTLPYLVLTLLIAVTVTVFIGAGLLSFIAILPVLAFFMAATSFAALVARSFRELTFLVTTMSVALSTYLFLPAIFTQVHPIAFISPISVVAAQLRDEAVPLASLLYSITPIGLAAVVLSAFATALYREESLFAPRAIFAKLFDALNNLVQRPISFLLSGILCLPFVFALELFALAFAITLPFETAVGAFLIGVALVEEFAKAMPSIAHYRRSTKQRHPLVIGGLVGTGFFLGEKLGLLFMVVGLGLFRLGETLLASYGIATSAFIVLAPLGLHVATATISAYGARSGRAGLAIAMPLAMLMHLAWNWTVIRLAT